MAVIVGGRPAAVAGVYVVVQEPPLIVHEVELKVPWLEGRTLKVIASPFVGPYPVNDTTQVEC